MTNTDQLLESWSSSGFNRPIFSRPQVAKLLNCTPLTLANREDKGTYPQPQRHLKSKHRFYTLQDVFLLQYITSKGQIDLSAVASLLFDMGYDLTNKVLPCIQAEISFFKATIPTEVATDKASEVADV